MRFAFWKSAQTWAYHLQVKIDDNSLKEVKKESKEIWSPGQAQAPLKFLLQVCSSFTPRRQKSFPFSARNIIFVGCLYSIDRPPDESLDRFFRRGRGVPQKRPGRLLGFSGEGIDNYSSSSSSSFFVSTGSSPIISLMYSSYSSAVSNS